MSSDKTLSTLLDEFAIAARRGTMREGNLEFSKALELDRETARASAAIEKYVERLAGIVRDLAVRPPDQYEEWIEAIKGPGRICPLCNCILDERGNNTNTPMLPEHHAESCPWRRAIEATR